MRNSAEEHRLLGSSVSQNEKPSNLEDDTERSFSSSRRRYGTILAASLALNMIAVLALASVVLLLLRKTDRNYTTQGTPFASLRYTEERTMNTSTRWVSRDERARDELWLDLKRLGPGLVALDHSYTSKMGLLPSAPFFWDNDKSIYVLNGFHNLHCLQILYRDIKEHRQGIPESDHTVPFSHVMHCLDALRWEVQCTADDTPLWIDKDGGGNGHGQRRQCRDWSRLEAWARENEGCYYKVDPYNPDVPEVERFKYCSPNSHYLPKIRKYFGYPADWIPSYDT